MPKTVPDPLNGTSVDTERLTLRPHRREDYAESCAMWSNPEVTRYICGRPLIAEEVWQRLIWHAGLWTILGFGYWVIRERSSNRFVGEVGFADVRRTMDISFADAPETGCVLARWAQGRGYATEAMMSALAWSDTHLAASRRTVCLASPQNRASIHLAEKCGYREMTRTMYHGAASILFERRQKTAQAELPLAGREQFPVAPHET